MAAGWNTKRKALISEVRMRMNDKKICFIICSNNELYLNECLFWLNRLHIPDGFVMEKMIITEAKSMTEGYNRAMRQSDAKYKVYLHQDTFIVKPEFVMDIIAIFEQDAGIGMIGMIGKEKMPKSGIMWDDYQRVGTLYEHHNYEVSVINEINIPDQVDYVPVEVVDGFIMITQYDVPWREDLFDKWDFYDASQSMEFIRAGYQVVVLNMKEPWCLHDCGMISMDNYETERLKYVKEYLT